MKTITKTRIRRVVGLGLLLSAAIGIAIAGIGASKGHASAAKGKSALSVATAPKPTTRFVENKGQWDSRAKFLGRGQGIDTWVTDRSLMFDLYRMRRSEKPIFENHEKPIYRYYRSGHVVEMEFVGGQPATNVQGWGDLPGRSNYLQGNRTISNAANFEEARLRNVYPGIDTRVYFQSSKPRYDIIVNPGADASQIRLRFDGAARAALRSSTSLELQTSVGPLTVGGLFAYQQSGNSRVQVPAAFRVTPDGVVSFQLGNYDRSRALVIDPIVFSSFLGGTGSVDEVFGVAVDRFNSAYTTGVCTGTTFPTTIGAYDETLAFTDGFVSKFTPDGSDLEYSTYIGGTTVSAGAAAAGAGPENFCNAIAVDFDGNAYVTGSSAADDFDISTGSAYMDGPAAPNNTFDDFYNAFALKLTPAGDARDWARFIGGSRFDMGNAIALGADNSVYVVGNTQSADFSTVGPIQAAMKGDGDAFLTKISADGSAEVYSTFLGGTDTINPDDPNVGNPPDDPLNPFDNRNTHADDDFGIGVRVDSDGFAYVLMGTSYNDAPKVVGSFDTVVNGSDNLVLKVAQNGASLVYGTFIGGNNAETPTGIALDGTGNVYITGLTNSFNYPRTTGAFDRVYNLGIDCFVTKLNRLGTSLIYSSFLGTTNGARPMAIAVDDLGFAHIAGWVSQTQLNQVWLPVTANADDPTYNGPGDIFLATGDAFLMVMNDTGTALQYCSYMGGSQHDQAFAVALDGPRNAYMAGYTQSSSADTVQWPTTPDAFKTGMVFDGLTVALPDGFLAKIKTRIPITINSLVIAPNAVPGGSSATGTVTISGPASNGGQLVTIVNDNNNVVTNPVSITIPAGQTTGTFQLDTNPNLVVRTVVKVTATVEGDSKFANLTVSPWLEGFTLSNTTVVGGNPVAARVDLSFPAPTGGMVVNLNSTVPTAATVPTTITVQEGTRTSVFDVTTLGVNSLQTVDLTASLFAVTITQQLDVVPASLFAISFNPTRVSGGTSTNGIVQLDGAAPPGGVTITLLSSDPAVTVPPTVFIDEQESSIAFTATTSVVAVNTTVTISATLGAKTISADVDVLVANLISLTVAPDSVLGGNKSVGTVGLDRPAATGGVTITLSSSDPLVASVPATVVIPSGATFANFDIPTTVQAATTNVTISADRDAAGVIPPLTANLEVRELNFSLTVDPSSVPGGSGATGTIVLDEVAPAGGITIALFSDNPAATVPTDVTVTEGNDTVTFPIGTSAVLVDTVVTISGGFLGSAANDTLTVLAAVPIDLDINPSSVKGGDPATGTVEISGPAPAGGVVVTLSSNNAAASVGGTVTVLEGNTTANFPITTAGVLVDTTVTITASVGAVSVTDTLTVTATKLISIQFLPSRVRGGTSCGLKVTLDSTAPAGGASIALSSSDPTLATIPGTIVVDAGTTTKTIIIPTRRVSRTLATQVQAQYGGDTLFAVLTVTR